MAELLAPCAVAPSSVIPVPNVNGVSTFMGGATTAWTGEVVDVESPIFSEETGKKVIIGQLAQMGEADALQALDAAVAAWDAGQGHWPQMSLASRIAAMEAFVAEMGLKRDEIVNILRWEIAKTSADAAKEFDRTMDFIASTIATLKKQVEEGLGQWTTASGITAKVRRGPIGVSLMLAPFNYPLNEMYAMLIPALLMGNVVVMKLPNCGGLAHIPTAQAFAKCLPAGVVNFLTGRGRVTCTPIMQSGKVDMLGFIGGAKAADALIAAHPRPHRLKVFSQLEGKNIGMVLPDADLETAAAQCKDGSTSYNGQRCTAVKLIMVHESVAEDFLAALVAKVDGLKAGLPWEPGISITPLPEPNKPAYLQELIADAEAKGARVVNGRDNGGKGGQLNGCLFHPAVVYPVTSEMRLFHEEQFGPVIPVAVYKDTSELIGAAKASCKEGRKEGRKEGTHPSLLRNRLYLFAVILLLASTN
jgi:glyceraldehyde-3-phosphate dehydrogenase (NADP+)